MPEQPEQPADTSEPTKVSSDAVPRRGLVVKVVAVVVVLALVGGAGFLAFAALTGEPQRTISMPRSVAGMDRDPGVEQANQRAFAAAATSLEQLAPVAATQSAAYQNTDTEVGPEGAVAVFGAETQGEIEPATLLGKVRETAEDNDLEVSTVAAGDDARGLCATDQSGRIPPQCFWATTTSFGQVAALGEGWEVDQLSALMVRVRAGVETTD